MNNNNVYVKKSIVRNIIDFFSGTTSPEISLVFVVSTEPIDNWPCFAKEFVLRNPYGKIMPGDLIVQYSNLNVALIKQDS